MYKEMNRAVYRHTLYRKLKDHLESWGFQMDSYDDCIFDNTVNGV